MRTRRKRKPVWWEVLAMILCLGGAAYLILTSCAGTRRMLTTTRVGYGVGSGEYGREGRMADMDTQSAWVSIRPFAFAWEDEVRVSNWREWPALASPDPETVEGKAAIDRPWWRTTAGMVAVLGSLTLLAGAIFGHRQYRKHTEATHAD